MDRDARSPNLLLSLVAASAARLTVEAGASLRKTERDEREQHLHVAGPIPWPHEYHALVSSIPTNATRSAACHEDWRHAPLEIDHASQTAAVDVIIGADNRPGGNAAHHRTSPPTLQLGMSSFVPTSSGAIAAVSESASPRSIGLSNGPGSALPITASMTVTTDKPDYAPGDIATFVVAGVRSGSSVSFQVADLASNPGINGRVDVYAPFSVTDGGLGDSDGLANGVVVPQWQVPSDGSATGATLQLTATSGNQTTTTTFSDFSRIVIENNQTGTPRSYWDYR